MQDTHSYLPEIAAIKTGELKSLWENAPNRVAFYAEFQDDAQFDAYFPEYDVWGLCRYRTLVAQGMNGDGVVRVGKRWGDTTVRQLLPDWHLDKLAALDHRAFHCVRDREHTPVELCFRKAFRRFCRHGSPVVFCRLLSMAYFVSPHRSLF